MQEAGDLVIAGLTERDRAWLTIAAIVLVAVVLMAVVVLLLSF